MTVTTIASLIYKLITDYLPSSNWMLVVTDLILLVLAVALALLALKKARGLFQQRPKPVVV